MKFRTMLTVAKVAAAAAPFALKVYNRHSATRRRYYAVIEALAIRYHNMLIANGLEDDLRFALEIHKEAQKREIPLNKLNRWLGYLQGRVISLGHTTVQKERDFTRPLLRPLDYP